MKCKLPGIILIQLLLFFKSPTQNKYAEQESQ